MEFGRSARAAKFLLDRAPFRFIIPLMERINLIGLNLDALRQLMTGLGQQPFRGNQLYHQMYHRHCLELAAMTDIARSIRLELADKAELVLPALLAREDAADGTRKFLFRLRDGPRVEAVFIPEEDRITLCLSTQAGCAMGCRFCATAGLGWQRDLTTGEILAQYYLIAADQGLSGRPVNIVFMGMGEPLLNYDAVLAAFRILSDPAGAALSRRTITLSTCGLADGIERLGREVSRPKLAVSLNAASDALRERIMPVNRRHSLPELLEACRRFPLGPRERITFEYVLLGQVNDSVTEARRLARLLRGIRCKINLIPFNEYPGLTYAAPSEAAVLRFQQVLLAARYAAIVRKSRGRDIRAACGQLAGLDPGGGNATISVRSSSL